MYSLIKISDTGKKLMTVVLILTSAALVVGLVVGIDTPMSYTLGLLLSTLLVLIKIVHLERTIDRTLDMDATSAKAYAVGNFILRYFLSGAVLLAAALIPAISLWGAVIGLLTLQFSAYIVSFRQRTQKRKE